MVNNSGDGDATACFGDSGGPVFYVDQQENEVLVGLHSISTGERACEDGIITTLKYRLDTASAQDFINANLP